MFLKEKLDIALARINTPDFIADDPVQFPRRFSQQDDIEIVALLVSHISWGKRAMILKDANKLLSLLNNDPAAYVRNGDFNNISPEQNIHRTFFGSDLLYFLRGLKRIYDRYTTLESFAVDKKIALSELPSWKLAEALNSEMEEANLGIGQSIRCLPKNLEATALKRLNMALRWLVRNDGIVDLGVWNVIKPSQLFIPLDVHVGNVSRELGLITRKANDLKTVVELTSKLAEFDPEDPVKYDFALFGLGVNPDLK